MNEIAFRPRVLQAAGAHDVAIFSGRLVERNGLLVALEACADVRKRRQGFEFRIIGDGSLHSEVENTIERFGMASVGDSFSLPLFEPYYRGCAGTGALAREEQP